MRKWLFLFFLFWAVKLVDGCSWDYRIWMIRTKTADPLYRFTGDNKAGYVDQNGKIVIPASLHFLGNHDGEFHGGFLEENSDKGFFLNTRRQIVFSKDRFGTVGEFSEGLAPARPRGIKLWGFVDPSGRFAIAPKIHADLVRSFSEGLAGIAIGNRIGYVDRTGSIVINPSFLLGESFSGGYARVIIDGPCRYNDDSPCSVPYLLPLDPSFPFAHASRDVVGLPQCRFSFIDKTGKVITTLKFDDAENFSDGLAPVKINNLWGYINQTGNIAIQPRFTVAWQFSNGRAVIQTKENRLLGYINKSGDVVIPPSFEEVSDFSDGLAAVRLPGNDFIYIDKSGKQAISEHFAIASHFYRGLAHVKLNVEGEKFAYIDRSGRHVFTYVP
jgi:hypothetical protein